MQKNHNCDLKCAVFEMCKNDSWQKRTNEMFFRKLRFFVTVEHRFSTFFEVGTPFIKIKWRSHPLVLKMRRKRKTVRFYRILILKLLRVIRRSADNTTENTQSYC